MPARDLSAQVFGDNRQVAGWGWVPSDGLMPRFFFHVRRNDQSLSLDELGLDLPDAETACAKAVRAAQDLEGVFTARGQDPRDYGIQVVNASGERVVDLSFSEIFDRRRTLS